MNENQIPASRPRARKRGCILKGCLVLFIVAMLLGIIIGGAGWYAYNGMAPFLKQQPAPIRVYPATDAQYQAVLAKVAPFNQALETGTAATLELTAEDLDILIARDPAWAELRGKLYLAIANNNLVADVSTPANEDANTDMQLYFNARLILGASIAEGELTAVIRRIETLSGHPLSGVLARYATSPAFAQTFNDSINRRIQDNSYLARYIAKLRTASIEHNHILVTAAGHPAPAGTPAPAPTLTPTPGPTPAPPATPAASSTAAPVASPAGPE
jgi:hypothetical protein